MYRKVNFKDKPLSGSVDKSDYFFKGLKIIRSITYTNCKCFTYHYKNACNLVKLYLLLKIHKQLPEVLDSPVISKCGALQKRV